METSLDTAGWESLGPRVARRRLPFLDATVGAVWGAGRLLVVDTGSTPREGAVIARELRALTGLAVTDVVLTHGHFDHVLGTPGLGGAPRVHGHAGLARLLADGRAGLSADAVRHGVEPAEARAAADALAVPDTEAAGPLEVELGGRSVALVPVGPGHTRHDLAVVVPGGGADGPVVFCGDLVEESGPPQAGPDAEPAGWPAALDRLLALGGGSARYVPGHGAVVGAGFVRAQRDALAARAAGG